MERPIHVRSSPSLNQIDVRRHSSTLVSFEKSSRLSSFSSFKKLPARRQSPSSLAGIPSPGSPPDEGSGYKHNMTKTHGSGRDLQSTVPGIDYEERIAFLEAQNGHLQDELAATRSALLDEREDRSIERHSLVPIEVFPVLDEQTGQEDLVYERNLRMEILGSLKKVRAQFATVSRSLSEEKEKTASLSSILESERSQRNTAEHELERISRANFTLLEHNKLLVGRDTALQKDIATLLTKSQADEWIRSVLQDQIRNLREVNHGVTDQEQDKEDIPDPPPRPQLGITIEDLGPLRSQLFAARDELHVNKRLLAESEQRCQELNMRVLSLQQKMASCVDSSARSLEMERELRTEVSKRAADLEEQVFQLNKRLGGNVSTNSVPLPRQSPVHQGSARSSSTFDSPSPKRNTRIRFEGIEGGMRPLRLSMSLSERSAPLPSTKPLVTLVRPRGMIRSSSLDSPQTIDTTSTLAPSTPPSIHQDIGTLSEDKNMNSYHSPIPPHFKPFLTSTPAALKPAPSPPQLQTGSPVVVSRTSAEKRMNRKSIMLATTLSRPRPSLNLALKSASTLYVDLDSGDSNLMSPLLARRKSRRSSFGKRRRSKRASASLKDIAQTFRVSEVEEDIDEWQVVA